MASNDLTTEYAAVNAAESAVASQISDKMTTFTTDIAALMASLGTAVPPLSPLQLWYSGFSASLGMNASAFASVKAQYPTDTGDSE
jgi:hypothetical protein